MTAREDTLTRRAAALTVFSILAAAAVLAFSFVMLNGARSENMVMARLSAQTAAMAEAGGELLSGDGDTLTGMLRMADAEGMQAYIVDDSGKQRVSANDSTLSGEVIAAAQEAMEAGEAAWFSGDRMIYRIEPILKDRALVAGQRTQNPAGWAFWASMALAMAAAGLVCRKLMRPLIQKAIEPVKELRNVAVKIAGGDFEARVRDGIPGEMGVLGQALNNMSYQLSRTMYTLILERNRLKQMIDGLSEGIVAINAKGHITHQNPALAKMFPKGDVQHGEDARLKVIPDKGIWEDFDSVVRKGNTVTRNLETDGVVVRLVISPIIDEIGTTAGAVGLFSDITQMERLERTRREYVANVSHEMRTPLTAMRALIEPLKEGMVTSEDARMRYYDIILREILRLSRLINDQLELSRLQSGTVAIRKEKMQLEDLVLDVCDRYSDIAKEHGLGFEVNADFSECPAVYSNPDRVEQMMVILLDNAIKYTNEGKVSVSAKWNDKCVTMSVSDTGVGISREDLPYVFDRFYKVDKAHSGKGSGLGLSIAKELLARMGEEVWVTSEQGKGSTFSFTIRRMDAEAQEETK